MSRVLAIWLLLTSCVWADTRSEVDRLFVQASSGEVRYRDLVQPSEDSLIAMADSAAKYLALKLNSTDARERHTLVAIFGGIGQSATPYLLAALDTDDKDQLKTTARCLGEVKDPVAVERLLEVAGHDDYSVRSEAVTAVGKTGGGEALALELAKFMSDSIPLVRKSCVAALGRIGASVSIPVLAAALGDSYYGVRLTAYQALVDFDSLAYPQVIALLTDEREGRVRAEALRLAGELEIPGALGAVERSLTASDNVCRGWALWAWARLRGKPAVPMLATYLDEEKDPFVRSQIKSALEFLQANLTDE